MYQGPPLSDYLKLLVGIAAVLGGCWLIIYLNWGNMYTYNAVVTRIVDGDTIDVDVDLGFSVWLKKQRVRMMGIDTPESRTRDLEEKKFGLLSKQYLVDRIPVGSSVELESHGKGKFGRILGTIYEVDQALSINAKMIEDGYAVAYTGQSKKDIAEQHLANRKLLESKGIV